MSPLTTRSLLACVDTEKSSILRTLGTLMYCTVFYTPSRHTIHLCVLYSLGTLMAAIKPDLHVAQHTRTIAGVREARGFVHSCLHVLSESIPCVGTAINE